MLFYRGRFDHKLFYKGPIGPGNFILGADLTGADLAKGRIVYDSSIWMKSVLFV